MREESKDERGKRMKVKRGAYKRGRVAYVREEIAESPWTLPDSIGEIEAG